MNVTTISLTTCIVGLGWDVDVHLIYKSDIYEENINRTRVAQTELGSPKVLTD